MKFSDLRRLEIKADYKTIALGDGDEVLLHVVHAGETNVAYRNALIKASAKTIKQSKRVVGLQDDEGKLFAALESQERQRELDRATYAGHVIVGWVGFTDEDGEPLAFSQEACQELIDTMPDWVFDRIRIFCAEPTNFIESGEATAKN